MPIPRPPTIERLRVGDLLPPEWLDGRPLPTDTDLPWHVEEIDSLPQRLGGRLLTQGLQPIVARRRPRRDYLFGEDTRIYYRITEPELDGCRSPDWFLVLGVTIPTDLEVPRSYLLWRHLVRPLIVFESISGDGREEYDRTPQTGKFWVYEQAIRSTYYAAFDPYYPPPHPNRPLPAHQQLALFRRHRGRYRPVVANAHGHFPVPELGVALGTWHGTHANVTTTFARWYTPDGVLLPIDSERADLERAGRLAQQAARDQAEARAEDHEARARQEQVRAALAEAHAVREQARAEREKARAEQEKARAEQEKARADLLAARLRQAGIDPDA